jgi:CysZ protein
MGAGRDFFVGIGMLARGIGMYARTPRLMLLGLIPALLSAVLLVGALVALIYYVGDLATLLTPFAAHWSPAWRDAAHAVAAIAIIGAGLLLTLVTYTAVTLLIGEPFFEAISKRVEDRLGGVPNEVDPRFWQTLPRGVVEGVRTLVTSALVAVPMFLIGLVPVAGEALDLVLGTVVGGWFLARELLAIPFERRGLRLRHRIAMMRQWRGLCLGFGMATFVCFLIPLGAVLLMPAAVAGSTLVTRRMFGLPDRAD